MKTFRDACADKFMKGAAEHKEVWEEIDPIPEIRGELCDLANYATLLKDKELSSEICNWAEDLYNKLK